MMSRRFLIPLMASLLLSPSLAMAQDFPKQMVRLIVPYPAGGGVDGLARAVADGLGRKWGQSVIIDNRPGASTMIGGEYVARAPADGTTLLFTSDSSITSNPFLFRKMSFDPIKDLAPITQLADLHQMVLVHPSVPANTLQELVALAKAKPDALNYASYGNGSQPHLLFEALKKQAGIQIIQVPFRGIAPALQAVIAGDVQMTLGGPAALGMLEAKQLKALAIGRKQRLPALPDVPTLAEAGYPEIDPLSWFGLFAPAATPPAIIAKIQQDVAAIMKDPDFNKRFVEGLGFTGVASTPEAFAQFIKTDLAIKQRLIATSGATVE
ncbi:MULTISPECIES: tripartite tricarboxylate transporter substrate binding protein [unclassified Beijerinckia]|uniref:Bug family tripartite tricarboxylate transporter substrate binding protein n=1 Tax=unclassified Beijerinckia TaxID=2638183 RepID=UPI000898052A|nr:MULTISPECIES: tripartite tricarboxylate transporter substrate binding protein [unclassified Beijerinckia]MDH7796289.1 tripartite-type tricarboxylate transporter receptor subunit TctC [Beijerinckia sp. GAS462]SEC38607.1 Tripartite-type tricarboxylate transporter, receptor component TctC [Beijerinckia sp. 28-YEA-48]